MEENKECCHKKKERSEKEYKDLVNRLDSSYSSKVRVITGSFTVHPLFIMWQSYQNKTARLIEWGITFQMFSDTF